MGEDPAASWLPYLIIGLGFILGATLALVVKMARDEDDLTNAERMFDEKEHVDFAANLADSSHEGMTPLSDLPPIPEDNSQDNESDGGDNLAEQ